MGMTSDVLHLVKEFRREFGIREVTSDVLKEAFVKQGFTIIYYNPVLNDPDVETVLLSFGLKEMAAKTSGFLYMDNEHRLVFINENLTDEEAMIVLAHEEGHYYCGHTAHSSIVGKNVIEEYEANEFVHFLIRGTTLFNIHRIIDSHKRLIFVLLCMFLFAAGSAFSIRQYKEQKIYEGEFYVTMHGEKYHLKNCVTIEGHKIRRLTKEDVKSGKYTPCNVCMPDH